MEPGWPGGTEGVRNRDEAERIPQPGKSNLGKRRIDTYETNGHIDDESHPFYKEAKVAYEQLREATDARGRKLKANKLCVTKKPCWR